MSSVPSSKTLSKLTLTGLLLAAAGSPALAQATDAPLFGSYVAAPESSTQDSAVADLNADGHLDIVTAISLAAGFSVRFGDGTGQLGAPTAYSMGWGCRDLQLGDLNNDGNLDVVTADQTGSTVSVRLGDGTGSFGVQAVFAAGVGPRELDLGDVDGDGNLDVAVADYNGDAVFVLRGDGNGNLNLSQSWPVGHYPGDVLLADLDGDGDLDLISADQFDHQVSVALNGGTGVFGGTTAYPSVWSVLSLAAGDINQDGKLDLVAGGTSIGLMLGDGSGGLAAPVYSAVTGTPTELVVTDLDGDGYLDVAAAATGKSLLYQAYVAVLYGEAGGVLGDAHSFGVGGGSYGMTVADVDSDGTLDLLASTFNNGLNLLRGLGGREYAGNQRSSALTNPIALAFGDLNGDDRDEIVVASAGENVYEQGGVTVVMNDGTGTLTFGTATKLGLGIRDVVIAELTGDEHKDVAYLSKDLAVSVMAGDGTGALGAPVAWPCASAPHKLAAADLDHDGDDDLLTISLFGSTLSLRLSDGAGGFGPEVSFTLTGLPRDLGVADITGDGLLDVVISQSSPSAILVYPGDGAGGLGVASFLGMPGIPGPMAVFDINADGVADVVVADVLAAEVSVLLADGLGGLTAAVTWPTSDVPREVAAADFDGDGFGDLAVGDFTGGTAEVLINDGSMGFAKHQHFAAQKETFAVAVGDLDGDAHPDLAVTNSHTNSDSVTAYRGSSQVNLWADQGSALGGQLGEPKLQGYGLLEPGQPFGLQVSAAAPGTYGVLILGGSSAFVPLFGGELVPFPTFLVPLPISSGGLAAISGTWTAGIAPGTEFWMQAWMIDPLSPQGFSASNALLATAP